MGNYKNGSDIDITLFGKEMSGELLYKIRNEFEELNLPYKIDVSIFDDIDNQKLKDHIFRVRKELYRQLIKNDFILLNYSYLVLHYSEQIKNSLLIF